MSINSIFKERHKCIHLIGIGGIGMSGIAEALSVLGYDVQGSDIAENYMFIIIAILHAAFFCHLQPFIVIILLVMIIIFYII